MSEIRGLSPAERDDIAFSVAYRLIIVRDTLRESIGARISVCSMRSYALEHARLETLLTKLSRASL